jgi:pyruvate/2-oxoglutarate dehydrogenase complex dihydrolipoamide dehydrogenase (E3) component/uncharacterized membrane protein YdjX (TVP38/TMEM64 family)
MKTRKAKIGLLLGIALVVALFFIFDLQRFLTLESIKARQHDFENFYKGHTAVTIMIYMVVYILVTAMSLPGAAVMSLAGGALFGLVTGTIMVSFASTIGATLAFLLSRFLFRDTIQKKFGDKLASINRGIERDGNFYLFTLRLVPVFPFFIINVVMGLTPIKTLSFYLVSQIGMLPGTIVYLNAGTQLGKLESAAGILSPAIIFSFALLGIFPLVARKIVDYLKARKVYTGYTRPHRYDYNLAVIGAGSAGLVSAYIAAAVKAKVVLIEKDKMGGDCLNTGCVPSKALIRSAKILSYANRAREFGFQEGRITYDFAQVMERVQAVIKKVAPHDSVARYTQLGVDCIQGAARLVSPWEVAVNGRRISARSIVIATGGRPFIPPIPGLDDVTYYTSDTIWEIRQRPQKMVVLGGGPIGCELAQAFNRLGVEITQVQSNAYLMPREDTEISQLVADKFRAEGITVLTGCRATKIVADESGQALVCRADDKELAIPFDTLLVAVGRSASVDGVGLKALGVRVSPRGTLAADDFLRTNFPNIFCAGDVTGPYQFTHAAAHQSWYAAVNALFGKFKKFRVDYRVIPWSTFTDPEVARVGLNEKEALEKHIAYEVTRFGIEDLDRAIADSEDHGMVKVLTRPGSDKILGVTIVGPHASDIIAEYILAMKHGLGLNKILGTIHIYPTLAEANKSAAGEWKKAHAPEKLLGWVEKYHNWMRN